MSFETEERIIATIRLIAMLASTAATAAGFALDADFVTIVLSCVVAVVSIFWGWFFNNNLTQAAQIAQRFLNEIKAEEKGEE